MTNEQIADKARALLRANNTGVFIKPGSQQYPHQWNWDAAFVALGLSYFDLARAQQEIRSLLKGQWKNGMLPHILYHHGASDYSPKPEFWQTASHPDAANIPTSGFTQPPILATCLRMMLKQFADKTSRLEFLAEVYPKILAWHRWFYTARDPEGSGLVAIIHPWESGNDNTPRFLDALQNLKPENVPQFTRADRAHVAAAERPHEEDYLRYIYLIGFYRDLAWDDKTIYQQAPFLVADLQFNVILHQANQDLLALARELGEDRGEIEAWLRKTEEGLNTLWDEEQGLYFDKDLCTGKLIRIKSAQALSPIYAGIPSRARAKRLIEEHLLNPEEFAPDGKSRYFVTTIAKNSPYYEPRRYWAGPVWINMNWLLWLGLKRYGYHDLAKTIRQHSLELVSSGFVEYYDPRDGSACGAKGFSWSAALALDLLVKEQ